MPSLLHTAVAARSKKGEDMSHVLHASVGGEKVVLCLIADGHGGSAASEHVSQHLLTAIVAEAKDDPSCASFTAACERAFVAMHAAVLAWEGCNAGTTCTVCIVNEVRGELVCANVGDSAAVVVSTDPDALIRYPALPTDRCKLAEGSTGAYVTAISADHRMATPEAERVSLPVGIARPPPPISRPPMHLLPPPHCTSPHSHTSNLAPPPMSAHLLPP